MAHRPRKRHTKDSWVDQYRLHRHEKYPVTSSVVPSALIRVLIRGILLHFSRPARRRRSDQVGLDWQEEGLLELIDHMAKEDTWSRRVDSGDKEANQSISREEVNQYASRVSAALDKMLRHPHPRALAQASDWLDEQLAPYGQLRSEQRVPWLRKNLRRLLRELLFGSRCGRLYCPRNTTVPSDTKLEKWALPHGILSTPPMIRHHILAHFHGSTFYTVKRNLSLPPF